MKNLKDISVEVTKALDTVLPNNVRCVFVLYDVNTRDASTASDLSDEDALLLLEDAINTLKNPDEKLDPEQIKNLSKPKMTN